VFWLPCSRTLQISVSRHGPGRWIPRLTSFSPLLDIILRGRLASSPTPPFPGVLKFFHRQCVFHGYSCQGRSHFSNFRTLWVRTFGQKYSEPLCTPYFSGFFNCSSERGRFLTSSLRASLKWFTRGFLPCLKKIVQHGKLIHLLPGKSGPKSMNELLDPLEFPPI